MALSIADRSMWVPLSEEEGCTIQVVMSARRLEEGLGLPPGQLPQSLVKGKELFLMLVSQAHSVLSFFALSIRGKLMLPGDPGVHFTLQGRQMLVRTLMVVLQSPAWCLARRVLLRGQKSIWGPEGVWREVRRSVLSVSKVLIDWDRLSKQAKSSALFRLCCIAPTTLWTDCCSCPIHSESMKHGPLRSH